MDNIASHLGLTPAIVAERLEILSLSDADRRRLRLSAKAIEAQVDTFIESLYSRLLQTAATASWFSQPETISRLKAQQRRYLVELVSADIDWDYVERRLHIGVVHHRVCLTPRWYVATCCHYLCDHVEVLLAGHAGSEEGLERLIVFMKTIFFDAALILDAYGMSMEESMSAGESEQPAKPGADSGGEEMSNAATRSKPMMARMQSSSDDCDERRAFLDMDEGSIHHLRSLVPTIHRVLPEVVEDFYKTFRHWPGTEEMLAEDVIQRLKRQVSAYWMELLQGNFDRPYAATRTRVGTVHEQIGVSPQIYFIGLARQLSILIRAVWKNHPASTPALTSLMRAVFFDISFTMDAYMDARAAAVLRGEGYATQLLANLTIGVAVLDEKLRIQSANAALLQLVGVEAGIVRHMHVTHLIPDAQVAKLLEKAAEPDLVNESIQADYRGRKLRISIMRLSSPNKEAANPRLALLVQDISDLVLIAPEIAQTNRQLADTIEAVDAVVWEADLTDWTLLAISTPVLSLTGRRASLFLGSPNAWLNAIPEPDRKRFANTCSNLGKNKGCTIVHRITHTSGVLRWVRTSVKRGGRGAATNLLHGVTLDISETFLEEKRRLESVANLAGNIAHEFNGLLTIISGSLGLLAERTPDDAQYEIVTASDAVSRGAHLTRQLQTFAQGTPLRPEPVLLDEAIKKLQTAIKQVVGEGVSVIYGVQPNLWLCQIDTKQFGWAVLNLLSNAREAMPNGGVIKIAIGNVCAEHILPTADICAFTDHVEVVVSDSGTGMEAETRQHAVEPFYTTKTGGSGLGLSIVHGFVKQNRGYMLIESRPNAGTSVTLRFPRFTPEPPPKVIAEAHENVHTIFIVEDDECLAKLVQRMLAKRHHLVRAFSSTDAAKAAIKTGTPDLVICDVMFHGVPMGVKLGQEIKKSYPEVVWVYMSGYTKDYLKLEPDDMFLAKPFTLKELDAVLAKCFPTKVQPQTHALIPTSP